MESIVRAHVLKHLDTNNILKDEQHGFRERRSCLTNLLEMMEYWTEILNEGDGIDVAYLDFRKAFDLVSHKHLLYKMSKYGITNQTLNWIGAFLHQRSQKVVVRGATSESFAVTSGVPQGSVLGPILFLIFINDLPLEVISPLSLFADDSKVFSKIVSNKNLKKCNNENGNLKLQNDLNTIAGWAKKWKVEFNVDKCKIMHIGNQNLKHTYTMDGTNLTTTREERDLGVVIDDQLGFDKHIRGIVKKANRMLGLIRIGFTCLDKEIFMNLYPVLVRPLLEYCVQVWSPYKRKYVNLLEGVQRRATKLVPALRNLQYEERLKRLGLTTLEDRRERGDMIETYKLITGKEDINPGKFFTMATVRGDPELTHNMKLYKNSFRLDVRKYNFSQRVIDKWNSLDKDVVESLKTSGFKRKYDKSENTRNMAMAAGLYV